jgi:hypothetical protein
LIVWDGTDEKGNILNDGDYFLDAVFTDAAGNSYSPAEEKVTIKRTVGTADIFVIPGAVRLLEGGDNSGLYFKVLSESDEGLISWSLVLNT